MAQLTQEEQQLFEKLKAKVEAPDPPADGGRREELSVIVDLSDEQAVDRAMKLGWLQPADVKKDDDDSDDDDGKKKKKADDDDGGDPPKRGGYFGDGS